MENINQIANSISNTLIYQLFLIFEFIWHNKKPFRIYKLKQIIAEKNVLFSGYLQNDAQELLTYILDIINDETKWSHQKFQNVIINEEEMDFLKMNKRIKKCINKNILNKEKLSTLTLLYEKYKRDSQINDVIINLKSKLVWYKYLQENNSVIADLFTGLFHTELVCPVCNKILNKFQPYFYLSLPILQNYSNVYDCLTAFFRKEILDDDNQWKCQNCKIKVNASKKLCISKTSKILIIHLKRFEQYPPKKKSWYIEFPLENLNISSFVSKKKNITLKYHLICVSNHTGNINFGHYFAYCKKNDGWYEFNDKKVNKICGLGKYIDRSKLITKNAYLLFYIREDIKNF